MQVLQLLPRCIIAVSMEKLTYISDIKLILGRETKIKKQDVSLCHVWHLWMNLGPCTCDIHPICTKVSMTTQANPENHHQKLPGMKAQLWKQQWHYYESFLDCSEWFVPAIWLATKELKNQNKTTPKQSIKNNTKTKTKQPPKRKTTTTNKSLLGIAGLNLLLNECSHILRPALIMLASTAAKQRLHLFEVCKAKAENSEERTLLWM